MSIIIPCFNSARFIEEAIRSVLLQGYPDLEFVVIDGGSTDGTVEIIRRYERWMTAWVSEKDRGQSHAINKGLVKATGRLFNWHNADDVLLPGAVQAGARAMMEHPEAGYVHGRMEWMDEAGRPLPNADPVELPESEAFHPAPEAALRKLWPGHQPGALLDRELVLRVGGLVERFHYTMDIDLLLKLGTLRPPYFINRAQVRFRVHGGSKTSELNTEPDHERFEIVKGLFAGQLPVRFGSCRREALAEAHRCARQRALRAGRRWRALRYETLQNLRLPRSERRWRSVFGEVAHLLLPFWSRGGLKG